MSLFSQASFVLIAYSESWCADQLGLLVNELRPGTRVLLLADGRSALAACRRQVPSLLILDGELDGLDGIALLRELRQHAPTQRLPCVLISERTDAASVRAVLPLAPTAYLGKPFALADLRKRLDQLLPRSAGAMGRVLRTDASLASFLERMRLNSRGAPLAEASHAAIESLLSGQSDLAEEQAVLANDPQITARALSVANIHGPQQDQPSQTLAQALHRLGNQRSLELLGGLSAQRNARLADPRLAEQAARHAELAIYRAELAAWLASRLRLDGGLCRTAGLLCNLGELALLRTLQDWLDGGGELSEGELHHHLAERAAGYGSALRARWRLPLGLRQLIGAYYALGAGALNREALVLNLTRLLVDLPANVPPSSLADARPARLLRLDPALLDEAPLSAGR